VLTTVVLAIFEPGTGRLRYTNAGHPPPLWISASGGATFLEDEPAPPLGVVETPRYQQRTLELEPGSTLLLYTDGLVENPAEPLDAGLARLRETADAAGAGADVDALCAGVLRTLSAVGSQSDDVTMIALHALARLEERVVLEVAGDPGALSAARELVRRWLSEAGAGPDEQHDITMACNEACQNAIEHGYDGGADLFDVILERDGGQVSVTVRDRGRWRTTTSPDRGRGLDLMRELMESVEVDSGESGSTVQLRRSLRAPRPVQADTAVAHRQRRRGDDGGGECRRAHFARRVIPNATSSDSACVGELQPSANGLELLIRAVPSGPRQRVRRRGTRRRYATRNVQQHGRQPEHPLGRDPRGAQALRGRRRRPAQRHQRGPDRIHRRRRAAGDHLHRPRADGRLTGDSRRSSGEWHCASG
jgi:anti-sigma regulatory factor (Ser/Thr protein kinase)